MLDQNHRLRYTAILFRLIGEFVMKVFCSYVVAAFTSVVAIGSALASDVHIGVPPQKSSFFVSLATSKELKSVGITLVAKGFSKDKEILDATVGGTVDLGLFALSAIDELRMDGSLRLYTAFTRPFIFKSGEEIFELQEHGSR